MGPEHEPSASFMLHKKRFLLSPKRIVCPPKIIYYNML